MIQFALVLHFYQPPTQSLNLTEEILRTCYLPLCDVLLRQPDANVTLNLSGSLLLQTQRIPGHDFADKIKELASLGKVEFLNSPIYHPLSPLTPPEVLERQLIENEKVLHDFCGVNDFVGIFPPELAIDPDTYEQYQKHGKFVLVDESSVNPNFEISQITSNSNVNARALTEIIRSYPYELDALRFTKFITNQITDGTIICTTDAEVFGHHYQERIHFLRNLLTQKEFQFVKLSEIISNAPTLTPVASTWQTTSDDLRANNPYPYWKSPSNDLQEKYFQLAKMASEALAETKPDSLPSHALHSAERHFDQGISSCHPYWLSNLPWWHPDLAEQGANQLIKCIRTVPINSGFKQNAEKFYHEFLMQLWHHHWSGEIEKKYQEYDQIRSDFLSTLPQI